MIKNYMKGDAAQGVRFVVRIEQRPSHLPAAQAVAGGTSFKPCFQYPHSIFGYQVACGKKQTALCEKCSGWNGVL
jgi:hypothetical protein